MSTTQNDETNFIEETKKAVTVDNEVPIDKKAPGSTFALVALSYPIVLAAGALLFALVLWMSGVFTGASPGLDAPLGWSAWLP
ncbi:hypothetical protein K239x_31440 [Planctomycetes bacterium K23_9]|uniref:Uncharacterized protein n=2 Tax=Stieleria marina TaxID=1930275 RepID=A0A517NVJ0_9BACT|nr:hypothetical protein K239x_31440 [Planctomycetes bacterium K23_9]